jgi:hypothetical protein
MRFNNQPIFASKKMAVGCGNPSLVPFPAKFTMDGKPLDRATVTLVPVGSDGGRPASGMTAADGTVVMTTYQIGDGVRPGKYKVCVAKTPVTHVDVRGGVSESPEASKVKFDEFFAKASKLDTGPPGLMISTLLLTYSNPESTPLECDIPVEEKELVFELVSDPKHAKGH